MKRLLLLTLLALPAWPNACTIGSNYTLSASAGHWTGTGCTGGSYIPGNGDTVTIGRGVTLTVDQNWIIGASGANNTTPAVTLAGDTGTVEVQGGMTMTARGDILGSNTCISNSAELTLDAGSMFKFDSSLASSPTSTRYRVGASGSGNSCHIVALNGTAASHVTVTSVLTNGALPGQFRTGNNAVGSDPIRYFQIVGTYADFSYIGDAATYGEAFAFFQHSQGGGTNSCQYCTFNHVGPWATSNLSGDLTVSNVETFLWDHNSYANSLGANNIWINTEALVTGSRTVTNNYFDLPWNQQTGGCGGAVSHPGVTLSGNVFTGGFCPGREPTFSASIISAGCQSEITFPSSNPSAVYVWCNQDEGNPHMSSPPAFAQTLTNAVFDSPGVSATTAYGKAYHGGGLAGAAVGLLNSVLLPNRYGYESLIIADHSGNDALLAPTYNHNSGVAYAGMAVDESSATSLKVASYKDNVFAATQYNLDYAHNQRSERWPARLMLAVVE